VGLKVPSIKTQDDELTPGLVVRYNETASRWFIAVVHKSLAAQVELEFLEGDRERVPVEKVESFLGYLKSRERVLSLTRENLCHAFYREGLIRLRQERADKMKRFLRSHGLRFQPDEWTANERIQIWPDDSYVRAASSEADRAFEVLLPKWLEPVRLQAGSRDPLGFQNHAERLANEFLPGLTVFTTRIGYYGFIAWAVQELNAREWASGPVLRELFHKLERAYALCEFVHHGNDSSECRVIGQRSKSEVLQSAISDRFRLPVRIMKNQESAGSLRLYTTSMESMGFAELRPEQAVDGLLPLHLTKLGERLAREFVKHLPDGFLDFALSDKALDRETLRRWGNQLCMLTFGGVKYRAPFLDGFLLGNDGAAEARYRTVSLLLKRGYLGENSKAKSGKGLETLPEEAANVAEEAPGTDGLSNAAVLLDFYEEVPNQDIAVLQKAAVYELLSLAQSSIFASAIDVLDKSGRCQLTGLRDAIVATKHFGKFWLVPFGETGGMPTARDLHDALFDAEPSVERAAIGGALLRRVQRDPAFLASARDLNGMPPLTLTQVLPAEKSLAESFARLIEAMIVRHEQVSKNKNRQRWCYLDETGQQLVKDDLRSVGVGWHAMRFPQLFSLCRDVQLTKGDLSHGK
jgi:hypothetical protein